MSLLQKVKSPLETYAKRLLNLTSQNPLTPNNIATNAGEERKAIMPEARSNQGGRAENACEQSSNNLRKDMRSKRLPVRIATQRITGVSLTRRGVPNRLTSFMANRIRTNLHDFWKIILSCGMAQISIRRNKERHYAERVSLFWAEARTVAES